MKTTPKTYLMILPVHYYRVNDQTVALESAFAEHLKLLKTKVTPVFSQFVIGMVEMAHEDYEQKKQSLALVNESAEGITFKPLYKTKDLSSRLGRFKELFLVGKRLKVLVTECDLVHTGLSGNIWFPMEFIATVWGAYLKKPMVYVVDIDFRNSALMNYKTGRWSFKSYILCKYVYDEIRKFQIKFAVNKCALVLLKGKKLVQDFGKAKPGVKDFLDAAHSTRHIIGSHALEQKLAVLKDNGHPLEVVYFGRLTAYKGVDLCIRAIAEAHHEKGCDLNFHVIGGGEQAEDLKMLAKELGITDRVIFYGALPFNLDFFKKLYGYQLLLATPLSEDTPRSALDAMAAGIPILAFDTYYYHDFISSGAVATVPWLSREQLVEKIVHYGQNRQELATMAVNAVEFAMQNTQEMWLDRRLGWTLTYTGLK